MFADKLRAQFVTDVIIPLCEKYSKSSHEGWLIYQSAYEAHRRQYGSFALVENRNERMLERVRYMMTEFFTWLYNDPQAPTSFPSQQNASALITAGLTLP